MTKQIKITLASVLFFIAAMLDIWAVITKNESVEVIVKPLLMMLLVVVYLVSVKKPNFWFVLGLFFSFLGDSFLLFSGANYFMFGLAAFLLAHVVYIKITVGYLQSELTVKMISSAVPFVLFFVLLLVVVYDNLGEMLLPVVVYGITISTFGSVALLNYRSERSTENTWLLIGALIFIVSDSLIALNKFYEPSEFYSISIMITYILAQFLICKSMVLKARTVN